MGTSQQIILAQAGSSLPGSPAATFSNVQFLLHGFELPWYDVGNIGLGVANYAATADTSIKPSWATASFYTGSSTSHAKAAKAVETGTTFALGTAFCVESMVYCSSAGARIFDTRATLGATNAWIFVVDSSLRLFMQIGSTIYGQSSPAPTATVPANTWTHCRCTYDGTTIRLFVAGAIVWSAAASLNVTTGGAALTIGNEGSLGGSGIANQYLAEMRIVKGEAVSTAAFAPPTATWPDSGAVISLQTNVTYANVLIRSTYDSNVADQSTFARTMTANGGAASSSGVSKFGGGSLLLDGTGDYVTTPDSTDFDLGTGDYQFQCWAYRNGTKANDSFILSCYTGSTAGYSLAMNHTTSIPSWNETGDGADGVFIDAIPDVTWTHVAVGRKSGILYTFVNGVLQRFVASSQTANCSGTMFIGRINNSFPNDDWLGSIDDLQLVKGQCQLYRSFLVPTAALPTS